MIDIKQKIGKRIKSIRKEKGFTQEKLAELIGIEPQSMSYMESGKFSPSPDTLQKMSKVLEVRPYEFYYFDEVSEEEMRLILRNALEQNSKFLKIFYNVYKSLQYIN